MQCFHLTCVYARTRSSSCGGGSSGGGGGCSSGGGCSCSGVKAESSPCKEEEAAAPLAVAQGLPASAPFDAAATQPLLFAEVTKCQAMGGATPEQLSSALRGSLGDAAMAIVREGLEALQADGAVYEREGRFLPL